MKFIISFSSDKSDYFSSLRPRSKALFFPETEEEILESHIILIALRSQTTSLLSSFAAVRTYPGFVR